MFAGVGQRASQQHEAGTAQLKLAKGEKLKGNACQHADGPYARERIQCRATTQEASTLARLAASGAQLQPPAPPLAAPPLPRRQLSPADVTIAPATPTDFWDIAESHQRVFFPDASPVSASSTRYDRVVALRNGHRYALHGHGNYTCLMAQEARQLGACSVLPMLMPTQVQDAVSYVMCFVPDELRQAATLAPWHVWSDTWLPPSGLLGQVCLDTFAYHVPPEILAFHRCIDEHGSNHGMAYVSNLAVTSGARRLGLGRRLMDAAEARARQWGCTHLALHCHPTNVAGQKLYASMGYKFCDVTGLTIAAFQLRQGLNLYLKKL